MFIKRRGASGDQTHLSGSITIYLALSTVLLAALFLSAVEAARTQGARLYLTQLVNSGIDSLFSQYHRKLWEDYRLLGLEHYSEEQLCEEFQGFTDPYLEADNYYPMSIGEVSVSDVTVLTDLEGEVFEEQVLDYMRYGIVASVMDEVTVDSYISGIRDGTSLSDLGEDYREHAKAAVRLEERLEDIDASIRKQEEHLSSARSEVGSYRTYRFRRDIEDLQDELSDIPELVERYGDAADELRSELSETRKRYEEELRSGRLSSSTAELLLSEIEQYDSYVDADGERRQAVEQLTSRAEYDMSLCDDMIAEAEAIDDYIDSFVPEDEYDEPDLYSLWRPIRSMLSSYDELDLGMDKGIEDKTKEKELESISELFQADLLRLLLPDGMELKRESLKLEEAPSNEAFSGFDHTRSGLLDRIYISEYMVGAMNHYGRGRFDDGRTEKGTGGLELEYILYGGESDHDNLVSCVRELVMLRTGLNLLHILSDSGKRAEARSLALLITGALGFTPIVGVMAFFIMSVWALGQAFCDVKALLNGKKVRLMHTRETFDLSLEGLFGLVGGKVPEGKGDGDTGLSYVDYLRLFLIMRQGTAVDYRCMDMIQLSLRKEQYDFLLSRCAGSLGIGVTAEASHVFSGTAPVRLMGQDGSLSYTMSVDTFYSY